jgi:CheY-like chemotaxis protein
MAPDAAPGVAEAGTAVETADENDRPLRVLVVDDHDINRRAVELILAPLGCDISTAADGLLALAQCETAAFDVIFMDVRMPELDGRETTRRLRAGGGPNATVPVIAVTADTSPDDIAACMAAGMTHFVSKPLTPATLLGALQQVLAGADEEAGEGTSIETVAA